MSRRPIVIYGTRGFGDITPQINIARLAPYFHFVPTTGTTRSTGVVQEAQDWWTNQSTPVKAGVIGAGALFVGAIAYVLIK